MSKEALRDAFNAGWNIGKNWGGDPDNAFDLWWHRSNETLDRSPSSTIRSDPHQTVLSDLAAAKSVDVDAERAHVLADEAICKFLTALGYGDVVGRFQEVEKFYA